MSYFLFLFYLILFSLLVKKQKFIQESGVPSHYIVPLFLIKILAGTLLGYFSGKYEPNHSDYWWIHQSSIQETQWLLDSPKAFIMDLFHSYHHDGYSSLFGSHDSFWNDFRNNVLIKFLAVLNLITLKNYYINSLVFNWIGFFGHVALFRLFHKLYPESKIAICIGAFLLPTTLFFGSGLYRDQLILTLMALYVYQLFTISNSVQKAKDLILLLMYFLGIVIFRSYMLIILLPASILYMMILKQSKPGIRFMAGLSGLIVGLLLLHHFFPSINLFEQVVQKRMDFLALGQTNTALPEMNLQAEGVSLMQHLPAALNHALLRPYPWEATHPLHIICSIELIFCWLLGMLAIFRKTGLSLRPEHYFLILFCLSGLLLIGYIVPNYGSIIRYRSLYLPFIMTPALVVISRYTKHIKLFNM